MSSLKALLPSIIIPILLALGAHLLTRGYYTVHPFSAASVPLSGKDSHLLDSHHHNLVLEADHYTKSDVYIPVSDKESIHGWLYLPRRESHLQFPVVVMSHGIGSQKDMGLEPYAERFTDAGFAVFAMDYRNFGGSISASLFDRNFINPWHHIDSIKIVARAIRAGVLGRKIDPFKICLWGTSFGGGHVLVAAKELSSGPDRGLISGVISQVPHLDGKAASLRKIKQMGTIGAIRTAVLAISDMIRNLMGLSPVYVKIAGTKDDISYMVLSQDHLTKYFAKHPKTYLGGWENRAPARTLLYISQYSPIKAVPHLDPDIPVLFIGATDDSLCPIEYIRKAWDSLPLSSTTSRPPVVEIDGTHFDVYYPSENFDKIVHQMISFLFTNVFQVDKTKR